MIKKIGHISIVIPLLISTMGFTVNLHYCNDRIYDIGIFSEAASCCKAYDQGTVHNHAKGNYKPTCTLKEHKKHHCKDETIKVKDVDNFVLSSYHFNPDNHSFISLFPFLPVLSDLFNLSDTVIIEIPEWNNSPPVIQVVLSFLQTYLL